MTPTPQHCHQTRGAGSPGRQYPVAGPGSHPDACCDQFPSPSLAAAPNILMTLVFASVFACGGVRDHAHNS